MRNNKKKHKQKKTKSKNKKKKYEKEIEEDSKLEILEEKLSLEKDHNKLIKEIFESEIDSSSETNSDEDEDILDEINNNEIDDKNFKETSKYDNNFTNQINNYFNLSNKSNPFIKEAEKLNKPIKADIPNQSEDEDSNIKNESENNIDGELYNDLLIDKKFITELDKKKTKIIEFTIYIYNIQIKNFIVYLIINKKMKILIYIIIVIIIMQQNIGLNLIKIELGKKFHFVKLELNILNIIKNIYL